MQLAQIRGVRRGAALIVLAAWVVPAGCGPRPGSAVDAPPRAEVVPAAGSPRVWLAYAGFEDGTLILEGAPAASGTVVEVFDAAGAACEAAVAAEPPPECDDCVRERFLARAAAGCRAFEGSALALAPPSGGAARVTWNDYPSIATLAEAPGTWAAVDVEGDGAVDVELVVWCGSFLPSGCDGRACEQVCRGARPAGGGEPVDAVCQRFIPDLEDCLPEGEECETGDPTDVLCRRFNADGGDGLSGEEECELVEGGCQSCGTDCRDLTLTVPQAERWAVYESEGVRMEFDLEEVLALCREHDEAEVLEWLEANGGRAPSVDLRAAERAIAGQRVALLVAALLEAGRARVVDPGNGEPVGRLVQMEWFWMGCGGRCRQSGREWRLRVPGEVFFKTTDMFGD